MGTPHSTDMQARTPGFACPKLGWFDALWHERAALRPLPRRSDFTARMLAPFLVNMTIVERLAAPQGWRYRYRLFGRGLAERMGDCTGKDMVEVLPAQKIPLWRAAYDQVMAAGEPVHFLSPFGLPGQEHWMIETVLAPIAAEDDTPLGFLGVAYFFARVPEHKLRQQVHAL
jgi:hypothetical protein